VHHLARQLAPPAEASSRRSRGRPAPLALAVATLFLLPGESQAAEGLYLTWDDCAQGVAASADKAFSCGINNGASELYCAFTMPAPADDVIAIEIVLDVQHSSAVLPDWWRFDVGGCREGSLTAEASFPGVSACLDMWQGAVTPAVALVQGYIPSQPGGAESQARIKVAGSVLPEDARSLDGTSMYYAARVVINRAKTVGAGACAGCLDGACLVLNSILIGRLPGSSGGDYFLQTPGAGNANWARWQGGGGADCTAVPSRSRTWGQVKSLFR